MLGKNMKKGLPLTLFYGIKKYTHEQEFFLSKKTELDNSEGLPFRRALIFYASDNVTL